MKRMLLVSACLGLLMLSSYGQSATDGQTLLKPKPVQKQSREKKKSAPTLFCPTPSAELSKRAEYGGYVVEALRTEKKRALFDLGTPVDLQKDSDNISWNSHPDLA